VIAPKPSGYGDSDPSPDDDYGPAVHSRDIHVLVYDTHGHSRCSVIVGDGGGARVVPGAGHFLQWERADIVNPLWIQSFGDLRGHRRQEGETPGL